MKTKCLAPILCLSTMIISSLTITSCSSIRVRRTTDQDPSTPSVVLNGYPFHAEGFGDPQNPVVIVLHGGPGADYRYLLPLTPLAEDYYLVMYDQRSSGMSPRQPAKEIGADSFIEDLDAFVTHFGDGQPVFLLGHSWGAMIASAYVGIHPEKVKKAVLIEPGFLKGTLAKEFMEAGGPGFMDMLKIAGVWFNKWRVDTDGDPHARDDYFMGAAYAHVANPDLFCDGKFPKDMANWRFGTAAFKATAVKAMDDPEFLASLDYVAGSENFGGEVLLVAAECNKLIGADYQRRHLQFFKNARLEIIPAAGHFMLYDNPGYTNRVIADFFSGSIDVISQENRMNSKGNTP